MLEQYYKILEIKPDADEREIKKAYRRQALKFHPDINPDPSSTEKFQMICEAYEILLSRELINTRVYAEQEEEAEVSYEEIIREAREKAAARARMKYEKIKAEKEFFENNDVFVIFRYIGNYLAVPLSLGLVFFPIVKAFQEGLQMFFGLFFFWIIGGVIISHIYSKRKRWFHPGKIDTTWKDVVNFFIIKIKDNPEGKCFYSKAKIANSTPFKFVLFKVREISFNSEGIFMHRVGYNRKYREIIVPRSSDANRVHFLLSFIKPLLFIAGLILIPIDSIPWRFIASFLMTFIISRLLLFTSGIYAKTSFLLTPFMLIKLGIWILIICTQTTLYPGLVLFTTEILPLFFIIMLIFLDMFLDLILRIFPFYNRLYFPLLKQPPIVQKFFENGYQNYLEVPVWSTIYPLFRWLI